MPRWRPCYPEAEETVADQDTKPLPFHSSEPDQLGVLLLTPPRVRLFAKTIDTTRPRYIFDLRVLPTFEGAGMSRRALFLIMKSTGCTYVDAMGLMGDEEPRHALLRSSAFGECVHS